MRIRPDPATKPYYRCLSCQRFRTICGGRPTREMDLREWCEYICDVMDFFHLPNAYVAKAAEVSMKTIERIRAINCEQDIMRGTTRRVEQVVLGQVGDHTCYLDYNDGTSAERINRLMAEIEFWRKENDRKAKIIDRYLND